MNDHQVQDNRHVLYAIGIVRNCAICAEIEAVG